MKAMKIGAIPAMLALAPVTASAQALQPPAETVAAAGESVLADPLSVVPADLKKYGSLYLRCDGQPNNITGMESFGRLLGAVTLLALFAPPLEAPDPDKRLFAEKGVAACSKLLDDPTQETNGLRRLPLILARALHRIEAKDYEAAISDVGKARAEASALGLVGNPYFERSMGLSFNLIEANALLRMGKPEAARDVSLGGSTPARYSLYSALTTRTFGEFNRDMSAAEEAQLRINSRIVPMLTGTFADRLEEVRRFKEAAELRDAMTAILDAFSTDDRSSSLRARAALSHALAGDWDNAERRAAEARTNMEDRVAAGKPENDRATTVECLDLYQVLKLTRDGDLAKARRNFSARSQWVETSLGVVAATNEKLRLGAKPDELFGALEKTPDQLWSERRNGSLSKTLERDKDNKALWSYLLPYAQIKDYEGLSKQVWNTRKSAILAKEPMKNSRFTAASIYAPALTQPEAILLHSALVAKARGYGGLVFISAPAKPSLAFVEFGNAGDPDMAGHAFLDADAVIAELRQVIPSPEELAARRAAAKPR